MFVMYMYSVAILIPTASSTTPKRQLSTRTYKYETFKIPTPPNIPDSQLLVKDLNSFVRYHGHESETALRQKQRSYYDPKDKMLREKTFNMMKQAIYATQDRLKHLDSFLEKYSNNKNFRVGYIFTKLDQTLLDMRRIYTMCMRREYSIKQDVLLYSHMTKKNIDVTYMVEFTIAFHRDMLEELSQMVFAPAV